MGFEPDERESRAEREGPLIRVETEAGGWARRTREVESRRRVKLKEGQRFSTSTTPVVYSFLNP